MGKEVATDETRDSSHDGLLGSGPGLGATEGVNFRETGSISDEQRVEVIHNSQVCFGMACIMKLFWQKRADLLTLCKS